MPLIYKDQHNKKAQHPVGLFRVWLISLVPVALIIIVLCAGVSCTP